FVKSATDRLDKFAAAESAWAEIVKLLGEKRKLADAQSKIELRAGQTISTPQAAVLMDNLFSSVVKNLSDLYDNESTRAVAARIVSAITADFARLTGISPSSAATGDAGGVRGPGIEAAGDN